MLLPKTEQIPSDFYRKGEVVRAVVDKVENKNNNPKIYLSRTSPLFLERLFELEVPEIHDGLITIKKIARIPGERAKIAVESYDDEKTIKKKVMKAVTDAGPTVPNSEKPEPVENLFTMMEIVSSQDTYNYFNEKYANCEIRYGDMKKQLAEDINLFCSPIRERILDIAANTDYMEKVARQGAEKARESAAKTIQDVRRIIGFKAY
jgi:hypothetical protein